MPSTLSPVRPVPARRREASHQCLGRPGLGWNRRLHTVPRLEAEYGLLITQRLALQPLAELNVAVNGPLVGSKAPSGRQANDIRAYVDSVRSANATSDDPACEIELEAWASWALAEAGRTDPGRSRKSAAPRVGQAGGR